MHKSLLDPDGPANIRARLARLEPTASRRWGTMTVTQMLCHAGDQLRCALGELETHQRKSILSSRPLRWLAIHVMPWPKGVRTAPEMLTTLPAPTFPEDRRTLLEILDRFVREMPLRGPALHPLFGVLSVRDWGVLAWRHLDHHLRQFGV